MQKLLNEDAQKQEGDYAKLNTIGEINMLLILIQFITNYGNQAIT